ncbi:DUF481 domain-containing protein [Rehaibacterium terrae]|jgi:putative salt-induced outer membrane protein|uniref:Putative salt-induced outer membrane protein n=1 Tax=Rehaibacterium terrae TaxID=1341696 RepID=A0A7W7XZN2_9GAMM|nr:DUF481 domain-containing protein [Rehaibacterium terrae]MBB5015404.1 putative salt-induced outer membrane protein [Rehaibacterium terrae]
MSRILTAAVLLALAAPSVADEAGQAGEADAPRWTGAGELGIASARGNSRSESLNGKFGLSYQDDTWKHGVSVAGLRARSAVAGDDGRGLELSANRYQFGLTSARKTTDYAYWLGAVRYERDDFAAYEWQRTLSVGYGHTFLSDDDRIMLSIEAGPGQRRAKDAATGLIESDAVGRGLLDYQHKLTANTDLVNTLLVETGSDNTFVQNDLGLVVAMNSRVALKAALQTRYNSDVPENRRNTDTLTTVNLVYKLK